MKIVLKLENVKNIRSRTGCNKTHIFENIKNLLDDPIVCRNLKKKYLNFWEYASFSTCPHFHIHVKTYKYK